MREICSNDFFYRYELMRSCWERNPDDRPTFETIQSTLSALQSESSDKDHITVHTELSSTTDRNMNKKLYTKLSVKEYIEDEDSYLKPLQA